MPEFQHGLCGCFDNCMICIVTYLVPCYTAGKIGEKVGESCVVCGLVQCVPLLNLICVANLRQKVREQKGIDGSFVGDLLVSWCCYCCALSQVAQEVQAFGQSIARE
jgi:Cys-rich protein (TIGR01571 family)